VRALLGPRFGVEATFIIAVAAFAGLFELPMTAILAAVFGAWVLVALAEISASRRAARRPAAAVEPGLAPVPPAPLSAQPEPERFEPLAVELELEPERAATVAEVEDALAAEPVTPEPERVVAVVATQEPDAEPEPEAPEPEPAVGTIQPVTPREWNVWDLERRLQAVSDGPVADDERAYLLMYLREYASPDGILPVEFDALVRESFGDVVDAER
jgi:hypothetical protein